MLNLHASVLSPITTFRLNFKQSQRLHNRRSIDMKVTTSHAFFPQHERIAIFELVVTYCCICHCVDHKTQQIVPGGLD
uniref:Uncharacterized protein n=1 Tax=Anguilla anguilla TaxID=7936 RepID=A0A0E9WR21_ANGAN